MAPDRSKYANLRRISFLHYPYALKNALVSGVYSSAYARAHTSEEFAFVFQEEPEKERKALFEVKKGHF
jgi:hypothetical protein